MTTICGKCEHEWDTDSGVQVCQKCGNDGDIEGHVVRNGKHAKSGGCVRTWTSDGIRHQCRAPRKAEQCVCACGDSRAERRV